MGLEITFEAADLFGLSPLSALALSGRPNPAGLDLVIPKSLADIPAPSDLDPRFDSTTRQELASELEAAIAPLSPHVAVLESIRSLRQEAVTCIVAGQQPGLFGGPLFNSYKALHVAKLAQALSQKWGKPVVPILWNHADDHDISEVHHAWFINEHHDLSKLHLPNTSSGRTPLSELLCDKFDNNLDGLRARFSDVLSHEPHSGPLVELAMPRHGESLARAWTRFHLDLFGHLGVVVVEPNWIRNKLSESLAELVSPHPIKALTKANARLKSAGFTPAIEASTAALVFQVQNQTRTALRPHKDGWQLDGEPGSRTPAELAAEIIGAKSNYSAAALLRPLTQDMALPVSAYVGGFGELAYHAQLAELRQDFGLSKGVFVPRLSCTLTDARCRRSLRQLGKRTGDFLRNPSSAPSNQTTPAHTAPARLRDAAQALRESLYQERETLEALDPQLPAQLKRTVSQTRNLIDRLAERVERIAANETGSSQRGLRRIEATLFPRSSPQERMITSAQFVARFGRDWIDELFLSIDALPTEHLIAHIDPHQ